MSRGGFSRVAATGGLRVFRLWFQRLFVNVVFFNDRRLKVGLRLLTAFRGRCRLVDFRAVGLVFYLGVVDWGRSGRKDPILLRLDFRVGEDALPFQFG
jgi:hypothetical protein